MEEMSSRPRKRKRRRTEWRSFVEAREYARSLGTGSAAAWTGNVKGGRPTYRSFESCRAFVHGLGLRSRTEWRTWSRDSGKRPVDVPSTPYRQYKGKGWKGYGDWLGTGNVKDGKQTYRSFESCRAFARGLGLRSRVEWKT